MARLGGITERRQLRRAAEQALVVAFQPTPAVVSRESAVDVEWREHPFQDPDETPPWGIAVPRRRWYRAKPVIALIATALVTVVLAAVLLLSSRPGPGAGDSTIDSPAPSATPTPTSGPPAASLTPPVPAPPPPSPSEAAPSIASPAVVPTYSQSPENATTAERPEIGVTRTPTTRAPLSARPPPSPPPLYNPSDGNRGPRRGCCGF